MIRGTLREFRRVRHRRRDAAALDRALAAPNRMVLVHQMGKVGSSAVRDALRGVPDLPVFHTHWINPTSFDKRAGIIREAGRRSNRYGDRDEFGRMIHERVVRARVPADVVSLVRDPIARNVSSYFQHLDEIWDVKQAHRRVPLEELHRGFHDVFEHDEPLDWFDAEIRDVFGIDVFATPFPAERGWVQIEDAPYRLLVLRADIDDALKVERLGAFLGRDGLALAPANVGADKAYADVYRAFRAGLRLPDAYVDRMHDSRFARHFFTDAERAAWAERWRAKEPASTK